VGSAKNLATAPVAAGAEKMQTWLAWPSSRLAARLAGAAKRQRTF
jgi:hypothetical protein